MTRKHYYMAAVLITYTRDGGQKQRHLNAVIQSTTKSVNYPLMDQARISLLQRMHDEVGVPSEDIRDFVFLGFSHLGLMNETEFKQG